MVNDLMPVSTESPRCSEFARTIGVLPPGTGLFLRRVILVTVPLPWPKPALNHPLLRVAAAATNRSDVASRLFATEPFAAETVVEVYERRGSTAVLHRWILANDDAIEALCVAIAEAPLGELAAIDVAGVTSAPIDEPLPPTFLICTQGSHDLCCGTSGVALADEVKRVRPGYVVRRVSHTGGHRFSPTFLAFPEGRMWAFADLDVVDRVAADSATADDHRLLARGWWGAKVGSAQVAECAVRAERADQPFVEPLVEPVIEQGSTVDARSVARFTVTVNDDTWLLDVRVGRVIPTIACEAPGGLPVKPGREFVWSIERR